MSRVSHALAACWLVAALSVRAQLVVTDPLLSLHKPVTGTGYYDSGSEVFPFYNITDGFFDDTYDGEAYPNHWSFWLTPQGQLGSRRARRRTEFGPL